MSTSSSSGYISYKSKGESMLDRLEIRMPKKGKKQADPEKKKGDPVLSAIANGYLQKSRFVWFMDRNKSGYSNSDFSNLSRYYGLEPYVYDPINGSPLGGMAPIPEKWVEAIITDCLEYCDDNFIARANIVKFGMSCLAPHSESRLTILVKKDVGIDLGNLEDMARYNNAKKIWTPDCFSGLENHICIAIK